MDFGLWNFEIYFFLISLSVVIIVLFLKFVLFYDFVFG